jgi:hypothetical protein
MPPEEGLEAVLRLINDVNGLIHMHSVNKKALFGMVLSPLGRQAKKDIGKMDLRSRSGGDFSWRKRERNLIVTV